METKGMTWRKFMKSKFLHASELLEGGQNVTIVRFDYKEAFSKEAGKKEELPVMIVKEFKKPIALSNRKASQLISLFGDGLDGAVGKVVFLYGKNEKWFGTWDDVLTFKSAEPIKKPNLTNTSKNWEQATTAIQSGKTTIEAIEKHYSLTKAVREELVKLIPAKDGK